MAIEAACQIFQNPTALCLEDEHPGDTQSSKRTPTKLHHKAPPAPPSLSWMMPCGILPRMAQWKISCNSRHLPWPPPVAFTRLPLKNLQFTLRSFSFWLENKNPTNYFNCLKQFYYVVIITLPCNYLLCECLSPTPPFSTPDSSSLKELPTALISSMCLVCRETWELQTDQVHLNWKCQ